MCCLVASDCLQTTVSRPTGDGRRQGASTRVEFLVVPDRSHCILAPQQTYLVNSLDFRCRRFFSAVAPGLNSELRGISEVLSL